MKKPVMITLITVLIFLVIGLSSCVVAKPKPRSAAVIVKPQPKWKKVVVVEKRRRPAKKVVILR